MLFEQTARIKIKILATCHEIDLSSCESINRLVDLCNDWYTTIIGNCLYLYEYAVDTNTGFNTITVAVNLNAVKGTLLYTKYVHGTYKYLTKANFTKVSMTYFLANPEVRSNHKHSSIARGGLAWSS